MGRKFAKNDSDFVCVNCGAYVPKLSYSSRNHCNQCLHSLHLDINPGDRLANCKGILVPIEIEINSKKGNIIISKCDKCGYISRNKAAKDDNFEAILKVMKSH